MLDFAAANAQRAGLRLELHRALADELPFEASAFDAVTSKGLVWALLEPERAVTKWMRVTRPGRRILAIGGGNVPPRSALDRARVRVNHELYRFRSPEHRSCRRARPQLALLLVGLLGLAGCGASGGDAPAAACDRRAVPDDGRDLRS